MAETYDTLQDGSEAKDYCDPYNPANCFDPGQNNEGFAYVKVIRKPGVSAPGGYKQAHVGLAAVAGYDRRGGLSR